MLLEARNKIYDPVNGLSIYRGEIIETQDDLWVQRMGPILRPASRFDAASRPIRKVSGTKEGSSQKDTPEPVPEPEKIKPRKKARLAAPRAKIVTGDSTGNK